MSEVGQIRPYGGSAPSNLVDVLERVLDKGIVIAGDIQINLLDIELLTVKLRLLVASVDKAKEMGIDWWEHDEALTSGTGRHRDEELAEENRRLRERIAALEENSGSVEKGSGKREPAGASRGGSRESKGEER
ncbi:gas vesicle protein [Nocardiopsis sp. ATB16-24]|uniref:gas vesicle protein n=1 Tax=Nocardiopsis sp. ATB16-24 TaxID=3019555 RepID=UPI002552FCE8|nr:gas vesicle protein [Nocardiopsis sp. ATB16-24]